MISIIPNVTKYKNTIRRDFITRSF